MTPLTKQQCACGEPDKRGTHGRTICEHYPGVGGHMLTSNEDTVAELEAAAAKWVLEKNKYTLECLRDARKAVLARMLSGDPSQVETTSDEPTPHGVIYDRLGWLCSVCGGWNHARDKLCTHTHVTYEVGSVQETKPKPTIEGLERLLQAEDSKQVYVWPDGYVHDTPPPEKAPEAHIDYNVPGCDCLGCELAPNGKEDSGKP